MNQIRAALKQAREAAGLTLLEAARRAGYKDKSGWAMVENGQNTPSVDRMKRMAAVVGRKGSDVFPELNDETTGQATSA